MLLLRRVPRALRKIHLFLTTSSLLQDSIPRQRLPCDGVAERRARQTRRMRAQASAIQQQRRLLLVLGAVVLFVRRDDNAPI